MHRNLGRIFRFLLFFWMTLVISYSSTYAEEADSEEIPQLEKVEVVAPPIIEGNIVNEYGSEVTIVTEEQIENLNAQDLPSALRRTPGVVISRHNPVGSFGGGEGGSIFIRGMGSSRPGDEIVTLVDGIPKFVSVWAHPLMDVLSVDPIQNIEVYKGAQPVLFGNMAFAAVNIKTKRMEQEGFRTKFEGAYGSYNTWVEVLEHGGKVNKFDYYLIQSYRSSEGHRDDADGELQDYFARVGYELAENWDLSLIFDFTNNWADDPGAEHGDPPKDGRFKTKDYFTVATLSHDFDSLEGHLKIYYDDGDIDWVDQFNETTFLNTDDTLTDYANYGMRIREIARPWEGGEILVGLDLDYLSGEADFTSPPNPDTHFDKETWHLLAPYVNISQQFGSLDDLYVRPSAGVRYIGHSEFDNEWGPQAGLTIGYKDTQLHGFYSRGINYPGIFAKVQEDLWLPGENQFHDLKAETLNHYEIGVSQLIHDMATVDLTFFYDDGKDRIVVAPPPPFPPILENIGEFTTSGVEGTITAFLLPDLSVFAGFTYLESEPDDLPFAPKWSASAGVNYRFLEKFTASLDALYLGEHVAISRARIEGTINTEQVSSFFLLNGKLSYDFTTPLWNAGGCIYVAAENLTDTDYELKPDYPMPGINGMAGVVLEF
jgi:outer membrane receptor protein involved in Fe transport